ncbi:hypothetical protein KGG72_gp81 [Streptomyces phage Salutena]|uniref:Uncharacterized protein n=1 Tax=Streptomyces phage Salutena TaxID=2767576 RepID=A0A7S6U341_9CAUD|nr:hypothetical protein KGG72_gp81 [Streptomyces phage Salutena]QOV06211.1 hypothetical protein CPT_Salutena_081 [Streptomyces phage Salutena]
MRCTICSDQATHYYRSVGGENVGRCAYHADQFGYPEYLVEINPPRPALRTPAYLVQFWDGLGMDQDPVAAVWPFAEELAEWWVQNITAADKGKVEWLMSDAAYAPYGAQLMETQDVTVEVTRVTSLPVLQCGV